MLYRLGLKEMPASRHPAPLVQDPEGHEDEYLREQMTFIHLGGTSRPPGLHSQQSQMALTQKTLVLRYLPLLAFEVRKALVLEICARFRLEAEISARLKV